MFTNKEVRDYSNLLQNLNQQDDRPLPEGYAIVKFGGGYVESSCEKVEKGRKIRFSVNIHDVVLSIKKPEGISIRNIYKGKVKEIVQQPNNFYDILLDIGDDIWARISKGAYNELAVIENSILFVMIKSAAISDTLRLVH